MSYEKAKSLLERGPAKPSLYSVRVGNLVDNPTKTNNYLNLFCSGVTIPSFSYNTALAMGHEYMGIVREMPTTAVYGKPLTLTVIDNAELELYKSFRSWMDKVMRNANQTGINFGANGTGRSQRLNYYDDYTTEVEVIKLACPDGKWKFEKSEDGYEKVMTVKFARAYPVEMGAVTLASDAFDEYLTFQVSLTYESYTITQENSEVTVGTVIRGLW